MALNPSGRVALEYARDGLANPVQSLVDTDEQWTAGIRIPRTGRGRQTQERLMEAASKIFIRDGFLCAKITEIAADAHVSSGSFYTYFDSKESIFIAVIKEVNKAMFTSAVGPPHLSRDPLVRLEGATRAYIRAYRDNAGLLAILEQVATISPRFRNMRREIRRIFRDRSERSIARLQREGRIDPNLDSQCIAEALTSMVGNFCYVWLVLGEEYDEDQAVQTLTSIWAAGIGLKVDLVP